MAENAIKRFQIVVKPGHDEALQTAREIAEWLRQRGLEQTSAPISADQGTALDGASPAPQLIIVLGGDGTMIAAARMVG
ncbi:MAG: NAD(+) kinase, partial [Acidobacteria bacterium]|nr:NAD(+) kinase [Acidobacteriota bacterium]